MIAKMNTVCMCLCCSGPHYKYENLGVSWLKFAGFSDIEYVCLLKMRLTITH